MDGQDRADATPAAPGGVRLEAADEPDLPGSIVPNDGAPEVAAEPAEPAARAAGNGVAPEPGPPLAQPPSPGPEPLPAEPPPAEAAAAAIPEPEAAAPADPWVMPLDGGSCPVSHPVKAKMASGIFHLPGMAMYARTRADRCYASADAAEADGLRRSTT